MADSGRELPETDETLLHDYYYNNNCTELAAVKIEVHDIVAVSQSANVTSAVQGDTVLITGVLKNNGSESETSTVRCYYGMPEIPPIQIDSDQMITLTPERNAQLEFIWNTGAVDPGTYWIEIRAIPIAGELDTDDNTCTIDTPVTITARPYYVGGEVAAITTSMLKDAKMIASAAIILVMATLTTIMLLSRGSTKTGRIPEEKD